MRSGILRIRGRDVPIAYRDDGEDSLQLRAFLKECAAFERGDNFISCLLRSIKRQF